MRRMILILLFLLVATPAWSGSLEIKATDRNGHTTTVVKKVYGSGQGTASPAARTSTVRTRTQRTGRAATKKKPAAEWQPGGQDEQTETLFGTVKSMLQGLDETMSQTVEDFKKDAAGGQ